MNTIHISTHTTRDEDGAITGEKFTVTCTIAGVSMHSCALFGDKNHIEALKNKMQREINSGEIAFSIV